MRYRSLPTKSLCVVALGVIAASYLSAPGNAARPRSTVTVTASPATARVTGMPCQTATVVIGMTNTSSQDQYADLVIEADEPLIASKDIFSTYLPAAEPDKTITAPVKVTVPRDAPSGTHQIDLVLGGKLKESVEVEVTKPSAKLDGDNLLAHEAVVASSTHGNFVACALVDEVDSSKDWPTGGWNDGTRNVWPDTVTASLPAARTVGRVELTTLDSVANPAARFGLSDWDVQVKVGGEWITVDQVRDNTAAKVDSTFPARQADGVRIIALGSNNDDYARIVELRAFDR